jgi:predicted nucleotidyltransferase
MLETLGEDCKKIILFGSYAYGVPSEESDIGIYVMLKDRSRPPILALEDISAGFGKHRHMDLFNNPVGY